MSDRRKRTEEARDPEPERDARRAEEARRVEEAESASRELTDVEAAEIGGEGVAGEAEEASGTVPGSVGGTTGTAGRSAGIQTPGASEPPLRGIDPDEVRGKVGRRRSKDGR